MAKTIPLLALFGLVSLMILPAPGTWGLLIGLGCSVAILVAAFLWLIDRMVTRLARRWDRMGVRKRARRRLHAGSGMMRVASGPAPRSAVDEPPRPSPVQERARLAALRREAGRLEPFRVR